MSELKVTNKSEEINIFWEGPFSKDDILNDEINSKRYDNTADKIGIYQIYGTHPLYGRDKLLYIGRTRDKKGFKNRLRNRWVIENGQDNENIKIYLGTIFSDVECIEGKEHDFIEKAEVLLIYALKPAFNSSNIQSAGKISEDYIIYNYNNYRDIYPILSSKYFRQEEDLNTIITYELSKKFKAEMDITDDYYMFALPNHDNNIYIGVDYKCWNETKQPIQLYINGESINKTQLDNIKNGLKALNKNKDKLEILDYQDEENACYISLSKNLDKNNTMNDIVKAIRDTVLAIEEVLKRNNI
jgi:hypothetical protein